MQINELQSKWGKLGLSKIDKGYKSIRISSECNSDLFLGINSIANRCLILVLPESFQIDFKSIIKENLSLEFFKDTNYIVLQLTDNTYYDLFDDLILSLHHRIKDEENADKYSKTFIHTFYKWSEFFTDKKTDKLSNDIIKGLIGELIILKSLIIKSDSATINSVLDSWRGPYDEGHDFILDKKDLEVKTKDAQVLDVRISSEYQLESDLDKQLELVIISVESDVLNGLSIRELVFDIKQLTSERLGDNSIFLKALNQKGLTYKNLQQYDNIKFLPVRETYYDCSNLQFPKLIRSNLNEALNSITYNIRLSVLKNFIILDKEY